MSRPFALLLFAGCLFTSALAAAVPRQPLAIDAERVTAAEAARVIRANAPGATMQLTGLRDADGRRLTLDLTVATLFAPGFKLYVSGRETPTDTPSRFVYLRGSAEEWPGSGVALTVDAVGGAWAGTLSTGDGFFELALPAPEATATMARGWAVQRVDLTGIEAGLAHDALGAAGALEKALAADAGKRIIPAPGGQFGATIAVESDHEFFQQASAGDGALVSITNTIATVSELYERQLATPLVISSISLHPEEDDPWNAPNPHFGSTADVLCEFSSYWQKFRPVAKYPRNAALFFTGKSSPDIRGQAFLDSLCSFGSSRPGSCPIGGYGVVVIGARNVNPVVAAHELGHIFGSAHTHCYSPPIDTCFGDEHGCYLGVESSPPDGGSVMSYCRPVTMSMGEPGKFGLGSQRVEETIGAFIAKVGPTCLGRANDPYSLVAAPGPGTATLRWVDPFGNETNWLVEQLISGKFKQVKNLPANSTSVTIARLKPGIATFRVRAKIKKDVSDYSAVVEVIVE